MKSKTIALIIAGLLIAGAILYLEGLKAAPGKSQESDAVKPTQQLSAANISPEDAARIIQKEGRYKKSIELVGIDGYLNVDNITINGLIGKKVILIDFWTYSCINCQRTLPYITAWYDKYKDTGLEIIGIHAPEFEFEKKRENVQAAIDKWGIGYPVVQDNDHETWRAYQNRYWPRKYLIDIDGFIVYDHIGEGAYAETEKIIQELLNERNEVLGMKEDVASDVVDIESSRAGFFNTPELYLGYAFSRGQLGNTEGWNPEQVGSYVLPSTMVKDLFYLEGDWYNHEDSMESVSDAKIVLDYIAKDVYIVAGAEKPVSITIKIDGIETQKINISAETLYTLASLPEAKQHNLEIAAPPGFRIYTFAF